MTKLFSPCKVNLFLDITGKKENGYHLIESAFHTVSLNDVIEIEENETFSIQTKGMFKIDCDEKDNIVYIVCKYFEENLELKNKYSFVIEKNIPSGAGLGGGSSNAASVIKFLNCKIEKKLTSIELQNIGQKFGADVPFFIEGGFQWASGIGQILNPIKDRLCYGIVLIYPNIHVSTKTAYSRFSETDFNKGDYEKAKNIMNDKSRNFIDIVNYGYNVFEENVFSMFPQIENYKNTIENTINEKVRMSGSGSTLYILYNDKNKMNSDTVKIKNIFSNKLFVCEASLV